MVTETTASPSEAPAADDTVSATPPPSIPLAASAHIASPRFGYAEVGGRVARTWGGYLLWLRASESELVTQLLAANSVDYSIPLGGWLRPDRPDYGQRLVDLPGLVARGLVRIVDDSNGQRISLRLPQGSGAETTSGAHPSVTITPSTCEDCALITERVVQADVIGAAMRARGGQWLLRTDARVPACDHSPTEVPRPIASVRVPASKPAGNQDGVYAYSTSWRGGSVESTLQALLELVDVDHGIIAGIRRGSRLPATIPVWFAGPNRALSTADPSGLTWRWPDNAMGKGLTDEEAQLSALAEAAERWSGTWQRSDGTDAVRGRDLVTGEEVLVAAEVVYIGHPPVAGVARHTDSNGLAAGVTLADAQLQALLELIEREALAAWWEGEVGSQPVSLEGGTRDELAPFLDWLTWLGVRIDLRRLGSLGGTLTHLAVGWLPGNHRWLYGAGTHIDEGIATRRAVLELVQSTVAALATPKEVSPSRGIRAELYPEPPAGLRAVTGETEPPWLPATAPAVSSAPAGVASAVAGLAQALMAAGHRTLAVDVTRPEVGVPVARVSVDGLRGMPLPMR